jgi:hypothetical protein
VVDETQKKRRHFMNDIAGHISKTLDELRHQLSAKANEARKILAAINTLEEMLALPKTSFPDLSPGISLQENMGLADSASVSVGPPSPAPATIRPDEYLGNQPLEAAKKYIRRVGRAVHIDEIADAISKGGAAVGGKSWKEELLTSLIRSTRETVKVSEGTFGLVEFYTQEQLKGLRSSRQRKTSTAEQNRPARRRKGRRGTVRASRGKPGTGREPEGSQNSDASG